MSKLVQISTGERVRIDSDGIVELDETAMRRLSQDDRILLDREADAQSARHCGKALARASFEHFNRA